MRIQQPDREPDVEFRVLGTSAPAGSKRTGVIYRTDRRTGAKIPVIDAAGHVKTFVKDQSGQRGKDWRSAVAGAAYEAMEGRELLSGPTFIELTIIRQRGPGHYGSGRNAHRVLPSAPSYPATAPDIDKLTRAVFDALTGTAWVDDGRCVSMTVEKVFAQENEPEGCEVRVWALPAQLGAAPAPADQLALVS